MFVSIGHVSLQQMFIFTGSKMYSRVVVSLRLAEWLVGLVWHLPGGVHLGFKVWSLALCGKIWLSHLFTDIVTVNQR